jgi:hypothetical protein
MARVQLSSRGNRDVILRREQIRRAATEDPKPFSPMPAFNLLDETVVKARAELNGNWTRGWHLGDHLMRRYHADICGRDHYLIVWSWSARRSVPRLVQIEAICHTGRLHRAPREVRTLQDAVDHGLLILEL